MQNSGGGNGDCDDVRGGISDFLTVHSVKVQIMSVKSEWEICYGSNKK